MTRREWLRKMSGLSLAFFPLAEAREVQAHGIDFEDWVRQTFFPTAKKPSATAQWDIPAEANHDYGGIPANPKLVKWGQPISLGDALRQWDVAHGTEDFWLIVGWWQQIDPATKKIVLAVPARITPAIYRPLWEPLTRADLESLLTIIKDPKLDLKTRRTEVKKLKNKPPYTESIIRLYTKIDGHQGRLQCGLSMDDFFRYCARNITRRAREHATLWGKRVPDLKSRPRK